MATVDRNIIKSWFKRGLKPLESHFAAWIDSFWHKNDTIPIESINQLQSILSDKANTDYVQNAIGDALSNINLTDASLTQKGIVQLTNSLGYSDSLAATQTLVTQVQNGITDNYYTKSQTEQLIGQQIMGLTWKDWVQSYSDLPNVYPNPGVGWLVPVADESKIYKWNGTAWVDSGLGTIPAGTLKYSTDPFNNPIHDGRQLATTDYVDSHIPILPDATTSQKGLVQLIDTVINDSTKAVTGHAVLQSLQNVVGEPGPQGPPGPDGLSAFEVWLLQPGNENKTVADFFNALRGEPGATGAPGPPGANGLSAFDQWRQLPGNELKTFDDYLDFLSKRQGFHFIVSFYNTYEAVIAFASDITITNITKDANISTATYSLDGVNYNTLPIGSANISIQASQTLYIRVTFTGSPLAAITLKGNYL